MKTHVAVYEESLFDLRGGKTFLRGGGKYPLSLPLKETLLMHVILNICKTVIKCGDYGATDYYMACCRAETLKSWQTEWFDYTTISDHLNV